MDHIVALEEKLQNAFNENAKLRVMQKEDEKLWRGMESKFSSTKTLCDQLTETLQHLASQVQEAEKDKELFESKFFTSAEVIDSLKQQMGDLSSRLGVAEENIKSREKELEELKLEKEQTENSYLNEQCRTASLLKEKDATIVNSEAAIAEAKLNIENLNLQLEKVRVELTSKEDEAKYLVGVKEKLERDKMDIQLSADNLSEKLINSDQEVKKLEGFVHSLATELAELDKKNLAFVENFDKLNGLYGTHLMLLQKDRDIASDRAQRLYNQLQGELSTVTVQKEALQSSANELYEQKEELKKAKESLVEKVIRELSTKYDKELSDCKAESKHQLLSIQEDHASLILTVREEHGNKEFNLNAKHDEELRQAQIQAETELKERVTTIRNEHDAQLKALKCQYEDDCKKLQDELDLQRSKEERQRALLQMQWRVMSDKAPEEQEVSSRKEYSVSSVKVRGSRPPISRKSQHTTVMLDEDEQDSPFVKQAETPGTKMLKKVENTNTRSIMSSQKQHSKVTRREHEAEAKDGRTTKRRKTKGTVMFEEPQRRTTRFTPRAKTTPRSIAKVAAISSHPPRSANIGDLFSEGSLNPYADDPYAFD
ncbi:hypothetical protein F2Q69_00051826 [Brassica cretica]|uniref:Synaptonemal complex protein 1 n=1 Tax=Brassica cretica TaxID=69181 RepID=A0A8S9PKQ7_BRACR|nr:hypothetical protein F2Q69_00051826 [Brassica cretica]